VHFDRFKAWQSGATKLIYDAIIVGYGPVGAVLANILGKRGLSVAVVERMSGIFDKPRAINIDHEVMRILQSVGIADAVDAICSPHTGTEFRGIDNRLIKLFAPAKQPFPLGWTPNLMFIQPEFEPLLRGGAARFANVDVMLSHEAGELEQDDREVRLSVTALESGRRLQLRSRYVIACDGATSPIRKQLDISQESLEFDEWWTVVDAWLRGETPLPLMTTQFCLPSGPTTYVVGPRGLRRWELKILPHEDRADYEHRETINRRLAPFVDTTQIDIWRSATYRFHALLARQWRRGRVFLAGDAAHQMPPFMAQGLCSGIRDAGNLGWKLAAVLRDGRRSSLLDTYEAERKPHIRELVATTKAIGEIIGELDFDAARQRDEALGRELDLGRSETRRQKFIPDLTHGLIALGRDGHPAPGSGALFVQPWVIVSDGTRRRLDDVLGDHFAIVTSEAASQAWLDAASLETWSALSGVRVIVRTGDPPSSQGSLDGILEVREDGTLFKDWIAQFGNGAAVVRPDKYVYGIAGNSDQLRAMIRCIGQAM
jgi:3-(3-hydroxy-phenyl)propionate hydroxylase